MRPTMKWGIRLFLRGKPSDWCLSNGQRLEFETAIAAAKELAGWRKDGWWPAAVRYVIEEIATEE